MKKLLSVLLLLSVAFTFAACSLKKKPTPSVTPSTAVSVAPSVAPSAAPSTAPGASVVPSLTPSVAPGVEPSVTPGVEPSVAPGVEPSVTPGVEPSVTPSVPPTAEQLLQAVTFSNVGVTYNGENQKIEVSNLPQGATVAYEVDESRTGSANAGVYDVENGVRKPGVYGVKATVVLEDASRELFAVLTVRKALLTVKADSLQKEIYAPHPEFTYTVSGLKGDDVFYFGEIVEEAPDETPEGGSEAGGEESGGEEGEGGEEGGEEAPGEEEQPAPRVQAVFTGDLILGTEVERYSELGGDIIALSLPVSDCYEVKFNSGFLSVYTPVSKLIGGTSGGLKMNGNYDMTYNGKVVTWQGVNYFDLWQNCFNYNKGTIVEAWVQESMRGLEELASYNVKAIRFSASFFYDHWWKSCFMDYDEASDTYYVGEKAQECIYVMHRIFNKAASVGIGLIPSVFWTHNQYKMFPGESLIDCLTDPTSESFQFTAWYQDLLLKEFNDHPALFMWEQGNEWNLAVDIGGELSAEVLEEGRRIWAEQIAAANVGYNRVIGSGDAILRGSQYHLKHSDTWGSDTAQQHAQILKELNPGITAVSSHIYTSCALPLLIAQKQQEFKNTVTQNPTDAEMNEIANTLRKKYYEDPDAVVAEMISYGILNEDGAFTGYTGPYNDSMKSVDTLEEMFRTLIQNSKIIKSTCYVGECGPGFTYGETVLQHGKHRNFTLSNGLVIEGDKLNEGLSETYAAENGLYPDVTYEDMLQYYQQVSAAQTATGLPLILYWNYEYNANINRLNDKVLVNQMSGWGERSTATEYSVSLSHFGKALCMLSEVKAINDAWDAANPGAYNY